MAPANEIDGRREELNKQMTPKDIPLQCNLLVRFINKQRHGPTIIISQTLEPEVEIGQVIAPALREPLMAYLLPMSE
jgi:hypothetical protein